MGAISPGELSKINTHRMSILITQPNAALIQLWSEAPCDMKKGFGCCSSSQLASVSETSKQPSHLAAAGAG